VRRLGGVAAGRLAPPGRTPAGSRLPSVTQENVPLRDTQEAADLSEWMRQMAPAKPCPARAVMRLPGPIQDPQLASPDSARRPHRTFT
jgi:hypothetical protein